MLFEFGEGRDLTAAMVTFKNERMCGFCRVCGLLEHCPGGFQGPPNMSEAVLHSGEGSRATPTPNPNPTQLTASLQFLQKSAAPRTAPSVPAVVVPKPLAPMLSGKKRSGAMVMLEDLGKHSKGSATVIEDEVAELGPVLELFLPHLAGSLVISPPKKRKVGRPYGSKNKPKAKSSKKKKSFGSARRALTLGDEDSVNTAPIMAMEAIED
ncbi:hypothetical protein ACLB2K_047203 [Fragaria x ananassa]